MGSSALRTPTIFLNPFLNVETNQVDLERYLVESATVNQEQLMVAKKIQLRQEGPLLVILLQLSFIDLQQFSQLLDWTIKIRGQKS
jgi:Protein of unknown function (DUF2949)